jgi:hypothetical protein
MSAHFTDWPGSTYGRGTSYRYAIGLSALSSSSQGLMILKTRQWPSRGPGQALSRAR